jgi:hypothetical protein
MIPIATGWTMSVNVQVQTHRDIENSALYDSAIFFGNHSGGEFILPSLGCAYPGTSGYSFHGPLKILWHGFGQFYFNKKTDQPRRFSLALWSRASSFSAIARHSAFQAGNQVS